MYHVGRNGQQTGPFSIEQLQAKAASGELLPTDLVWKEGMSGWEPASSLPGVFGPAPSATPSASAPVSTGAFPGMPQAPLAQSTVLPPGTGVPTGPRTNPMALTGMILGILSIVVCCCYGFPFNIAGIVFSLIGLNQIKADPANQTGRGMAVAGLSCSIASIVIYILMFVFWGAMNWQEMMNHR